MRKTGTDFHRREYACKERPESGPGPIVSRADHPYVPNGDENDFAGTGPTYRIADLTNPILQPWVIEQMKKDNDEVLAGKVPFMARERCYPEVCRNG